MTAPKIEPRYMAVGRLFQENFIFHVPKYQRGYAWGESEVEDFLNDVWKCYEARVAGQQRHHLFGGVVSAEGPSPGSARRLCELIDGQQRIATFIIFVVQLILAYDRLSEGKRTSGNATNRTLAASRAGRLRDKYLQYQDEINRQPVTVDRFKLSSRDQLFFKELVDGSNPTPSRDSHERLSGAFEQIRVRLDTLLDKHSTLNKKLDALQRFDQRWMKTARLSTS